MCETLAGLRSGVEGFASTFDARTLSAAAAARVRADATALKNMAAAIEALAAAREAECGDWRRAGYRSPAEHLAQCSGTSVGAAIETLRAAERLESLPAVAAAACRGQLSAPQVAAVAGAASVAPAESERLVGEAQRLSLKELQSECGRTRAAHVDAEAQRRRIHAERAVRTWTDPEGAGHLSAVGPAETIAAISARISAERDVIFGQARREGRQELSEAYAFDALAAICTGEAASGAPTCKIIGRIDLDALLRGSVADGETCDVAGVPVAVSVIEDLLASGSAFLAAVITQTERIAGVLHFGRVPTAKQQTALEWLYPTCAVEGCSQSARLERDHRQDWASTKVTVFELLDLLCHHHHGLKTTKGWALVEGRGKRAFVPPEDERHPGHGPPTAA
jgi:hypothetical protein